MTYNNAILIKIDGNNILQEANNIKTILNKFGYIIINSSIINNNYKDNPDNSKTPKERNKNNNLEEFENELLNGNWY